MQPLSNTVYWRGIINKKAWIQIPSEDLVQAIIQRTGTFEVGIMDAVIKQILTRCDRIARAWTRYDADADDLVIEAIEMVCEALSTPSGQHASALSRRFASVVIFSIRMERRKRRRRAEIAPTVSLDDPDRPFEAPATMVHAEHRRTQRALDIRTQMNAISDPRTLELLALRAGGLTNRMAAKVMNLPHAVVRSLLDATDLHDILAA